MIDSRRATARCGSRRSGPTDRPTVLRNAGAARDEWTGGRPWSRGRGERLCDHDGIARISVGGESPFRLDSSVAAAAFDIAMAVIVLVRAAAVCLAIVLMLGSRTALVGGERRRRRRRARAFNPANPPLSAQRRKRAGRETKLTTRHHHRCGSATIRPECRLHTKRLPGRLLALAVGVLARLVG